MTNLVADLRTMGTADTVPDMKQMDELLLSAADEIELHRAALKVAQQSLIEVNHAQEAGPTWFTHREAALYRQVNHWLRRGLEAVKDALGPYDDHGKYLKEKVTP